MSTSETVTFEKGPCPCGGGQVAQHVTTQDNPWSTADISYSIECSKCRTEWRLDGYAGLIVLRSSEKDYIEAKRIECAAYDEFTAAFGQIITSYFTEFAAKNTKQEHAEIARLNLSTMSYRQYLAHKRNGGTAATACSGLRNTTWLLHQAESASQQDEISKLLSKYEEAQNETSMAASRIIRRRVA